MNDNDPRRHVQQIREALARFERDQLVEILTHVFRHYVMEGGPAVSLPPPSGLGTEELAGLTFPQVIERLQLRLDLPELQLFEISQGRVSVRASGQLVPLDAPRGAAPQEAARPVMVKAQIAPRPQAAGPQPEGQKAAPGVYAEAAPGRASAAPAPAAPAAAPPQPTPLGHASAARPDGAGPAPRPPAPRPAPPPAPARPAAAPQKDDKGEDSVSRFSLLEID